MKAGELVLYQLKQIFMVDIDREKSGMLEKAEEYSLRAFSAFDNKYNFGVVDPFNGVMYTNYLYWLSRFFYESDDEAMASKIYALNRMLHACDLFYAINLPLIWSCEHPIGTVMGKAQYGERFFFYQGCTVGGNEHKGKTIYPVIGNDVMMLSNSKVLGDSNIGNNVIIAANTYIINQDIPDDSIVFGQSPNIVIKENRNGL